MGRKFRLCKDVGRTGVLIVFVCASESDDKKGVVVVIWIFRNPKMHGTVVDHHKRGKKFRFVCLLILGSSDFTVLHNTAKKNKSQWHSEHIRIADFCFHVFCEALRSCG